MTQQQAPEHFKQYQLLDSGNGEKLERFGEYILIRPEPQALWRRGKPEASWLKEAHVRFVQKGSHGGQWQQLKPMPERWNVQYQAPEYEIGFRLALTGFKHVGLFPEQAANWDFIYSQVQRLRQAGIERPEILNLFAYTGGASLAAQAAGAAVTHVDSIKQVVNWAADNQKLNAREGIRWIVDDAMKFIQRAARRGTPYHGILLDPPAYGHGPNGERWKLEDMIDEMIAQITALLHPDSSLLLLNVYSLGLSSLVVESLLRTHLQPKAAQLRMAELYLPDDFGRKLPTGVAGRYIR